MNYEQLSVDLNVYCKEVLGLIWQDYKDDLSPEQMNFLLDLLSNGENIVVESNGDHFIQEQNSNNVPIVHGGRTFGDNKIHIYPFVLKDVTTYEEYLQICKGVITHEVFHYFINPSIFIEKDLATIENKDEMKAFNHFIKEGIVDMYARDFAQRHKEEGVIYDRSNYGKNVIFVRQMLESINAGDNIDKLVFNSDKQNILTIADSISNQNHFEMYMKAKEKLTPVEELLEKLVSDLMPENSKNTYLWLLNYCANFKRSDEMLYNLIKMIDEQYQDNNNYVKAKELLINYQVLYINYISEENNMTI